MCHLKLNDLERKKNAKLVVINRKKKKEAKCKMPKQKSEHDFPAQVFQRHFHQNEGLIIVTIIIPLSLSETNQTYFQISFCKNGYITKYMLICHLLTDEK